jgi:hypothetical protein
MAEDHVSIIIGRAVTDSKFRALLLTDPEKALEEYDLTEEEKESLQKIKKDDLEDFSGKLDDRITKSKMW